MRPIPSQAINLVKDKEKLVLFAYDDAHWPPREAKPGDHIEGTLTAGWGHTGRDVQIGMKVTEPLAEQWLENDLEEAAYSLTAKGGADVINSLTENQYAALLDFVFSLGTGSPKKPEWTIWKRLRAKAYDQIPLEIAKFVNYTVKEKDGTEKTIKSNGLVDRRNAEIGLWAVAEPGTVDDHVPASVTRCNPTPPTPTVPGRSKALVASAVAGAASAAPMIDKISDGLQKYSAHSHYVQGMLSILATVGAICAAIGIYYTWRNARNARN